MRSTLSRETGWSKRLHQQEQPGRRRRTEAAQRPALPAPDTGLRDHRWHGRLRRAGIGYLKTHTGAELDA
ncbi:hypothetical protein GCM10025792_01330 [Pseudonocardia tropica]